MKFETDLVNEGTKNSANWVTEAAPYFILEDTKWSQQKELTTATAV